MRGPPQQEKQKETALHAISHGCQARSRTSPQHTADDPLRSIARSRHVQLAQAPTHPHLHRPHQAGAVAQRWGHAETAGLAEALRSITSFHRDGWPSVDLAMPWSLCRLHAPLRRTLTISGSRGTPRAVLSVLRRARCSACHKLDQQHTAHRRAGFPPPPPRRRNEFERAWVVADQDSPLPLHLSHVEWRGNLLLFEAAWVRLAV